MIGCRFQHKISGRKKYKAHAQKPRNDALGAVIVKIPNTESALGQFSYDDGGHEIAGDYKKNIDSNKSARDEIDLVMEEHHRGDREGPKGVDVVTELHVSPLANRS